MLTLVTLTCALINSTRTHSHAHTCVHAQAVDPFVLQTGAGLRSGTWCCTGVNKDKKNVYIKADVKCKNIQFKSALSLTMPHLVKTPARVMTTSSSPSSPSLWPVRITITQPDPNKQQLPQLTDKESATIAHRRGHPIKQAGVAVGVIRLALLEPSFPPSFTLFPPAPIKWVRWPKSRARGWIGVESHGCIPRQGIVPILV